MNFIVSEFLFTVFAVPMVGLNVVLLILKFVCFVRDIYNNIVLELKNFYEKHLNLFLSLKCFFVLYGSFIIMFLAVLYFYTSTFPLVIAFIRVPLFFMTKIILVIRISKRVLKYLERRRLNKHMGQLEMEMIVAGGFSGTLVAAKDARIVFRIPNYEKIGGTTDFYEKALEESEKYGKFISGKTNLSVSSDDIKFIKRNIVAERTHYKIGFKHSDGKGTCTFNLTSDGAKLPRKFHGYDSYLNRIFVGNTKFEELSNRMMIAPSNKGQFMVTNPAQFHSPGNIIHINDLPSELRNKINPEFFDERLMTFLSLLKNSYGGQLEELNSVSSEGELRQILSKINSQKSCNIQDYRSFVAYEDYFYTVLTDFFL